MISQSQLDLFDPKGGRRGRCDGEFSQHSILVPPHPPPAMNQTPPLPTRHAPASRWPSTLGPPKASRGHRPPA